MAFSPPSIQLMYHNRQLTSPLVQVVLFSIVIVLFSWFIVKPQVAKVRARHSELNIAKAQLAKVDQDGRDLNRLVNQLQASSNEIAITDEALPLNGRATKLHVLLDSLVRSSGMELAQVSVEDLGTIISAGNKQTIENPFGVSRKLQTTTLLASVTGTVDQFKSLLELIETNGRVLDITSMEIMGGEPVTRFRIKVRAYAFEAI
ncbi:MAG: hypothetical protein M3Q64_02600 [bacterium]|nr:hypothetical protein [bacterium]